MDKKLEQAAAKKGKNPKEYVDEISKRFKDIWESFGISYDKFIRTTDSIIFKPHKKHF